jgi:hypothetical protein
MHLDNFSKQKTVKLRLDWLLVVFLIGPLFSVVSKAQVIERDVISAGGNAIENSEVLLSVTIGEAVSNVLESSNSILSTGFEQEPNAFSLSFIEQTKAELTVYPNPVAKTLHIKSDQPIHSVVIINGLGKEVFNSQASGLYTTLSVDALSAGVYYVNIHQDSKITSTKFIKL